MEQRPGWLVVPVALVALLAVLAMIATTSPATMQDASGPDVVGEVADAVVTGDAPRERVVLVDATGHRSSPRSLPALTAGALVLRFDAPFAGRDVDLTVHEHGAKEKQAPVLQANLRVRADGTLPVVGLPAGRYDVTAVAGSGQAMAVDVVVAASGRRSARVVTAVAAPSR